MESRSFKSFFNSSRSFLEMLEECLISELMYCSRFFILVSRRARVVMTEGCPFPSRSILESCSTEVWTLLNSILMVWMAMELEETLLAIFSNRD